MAAHTEPSYGDCTRCGGTVPRHVTGIMCPDCVNETPGTDDCSLCQKYGERTCGYHATCWWYCTDCGYIRRVGNHPSRPGSGDTVACLNTDAHSWPDLPRMVRLTYTSLTEPRLREYIEGRCYAAMSADEPDGQESQHETVAEIEMLYQQRMTVRIPVDEVPPTPESAFHLVKNTDPEFIADVLPHSWDHAVSVGNLNVLDVTDGGDA